MNNCSNAVAIDNKFTGLFYVTQLNAHLFECLTSLVKVLLPYLMCRAKHTCIQFREQILSEPLNLLAFFYSDLIESICLNDTFDQLLLTLCI